MACSAEQYEFADYEQLLPRGAISAITEPEYVSAAEAEIDDDTYVLGVVIGGEARAYSLNILNTHTGVVYDRNYNGKQLTFEASGGLINASLVMQDRETDSYWAIMRGESLEGEMKGQALQEIAQNRKMTWGEWREKYPHTLVLSVDGHEDSEEAYDNYFQSSEGFRGATASDVRLPTKAPIFAFRLDGASYAVAHDTVVNGKLFQLASESVFLHRGPNDGLHDSTQAFSSTVTGCEFDVEQDSGGDCAKPLLGFDTYWYNWSLNNPDTVLLE
ncbi:MAG: hypothetical protein ACI9GW_002919 [Halieaceae bacterium]|jgi:hypothetical protein